MNWSYIEFEFPVPVVINKVMAWGSNEKVSDNAPRLYFACKLSSNDVAWSYYAGDSDHALAPYRTLYPRLDEADARNNYWEAGRDESGCFLAMMPAHVQIRYVRMYVGFETGEEFDVYEFRPSVFVSANEIVSGTLLITDQLATSPVISVRKGGITRLTLGNFASSHYGLVGYNDTGDLIFELSDRQQIIAGWQFTNTLLRSSASGARIELNPGKSRISIFDSVNEKVAMGYLDGLPKNDGTGNWGSGDYGFWARNGDTLRIDGSGEYINGDWIIKNDASYLVHDANDNVIVRLGTHSGQKGLFIYDASGNVLAKHASDELYLGDPAGTKGYLRYTTADGLVLSGKMSFIENTPIDTSLIEGTVSSGLSKIVIDSEKITGYNAIGSKTFQLRTDGSGQIGTGYMGGAVMTWTPDGSVIVPGHLITSGINAEYITVGYLSASRIAAGSIEATHIKAGTITGDRISASARITIDANGSLTIGNVGGTGPTDYVELTQGDMVFRYYDAIDEDYKIYKTLRRVEMSIAVSGEWAYIDGIFKNAPNVLVVPLNMPIYDKDGQDQDQVIYIEASSIEEYDPVHSPRKYRFMPTAVLRYAEAIITQVCSVPKPAGSGYYTDNYDPGNHGPTPPDPGFLAAFSNIQTTKVSLPINVRKLSVSAKAYNYYHCSYETPAGYAAAAYYGIYAYVTLHYNIGTIDTPVWLASTPIAVYCAYEASTVILAESNTDIVEFYVSQTGYSYSYLYATAWFGPAWIPRRVGQATISIEAYTKFLAETTSPVVGTVKYIAIE